MKKPFIEKEHYYYTEEGLMVLTEKYLLERGFCCGNGCKHCPYPKPLKGLNSTIINEDLFNNDDANTNGKAE